MQHSNRILLRKLERKTSMECTTMSDPTSPTVSIASSKPPSYISDCATETSPMEQYDSIIARHAQELEIFKKTMHKEVHSLYANDHEYQQLQLQKHNLLNELKQVENLKVVFSDTQRQAIIKDIKNKISMVDNNIKQYMRHGKHKEYYNALVPVKDTQISIKSMIYEYCLDEHKQDLFPLHYNFNDVTQDFYIVMKDDRVPELMCRLHNMISDKRIRKRIAEISNEYYNVFFHEFSYFAKNKTPYPDYYNKKRFIYDDDYLVEPNKDPEMMSFKENLYYGGYYYHHMQTLLSYFGFIINGGINYSVHYSVISEEKNERLVSIHFTQYNKSYIYDYMTYALKEKYNKDKPKEHQKASKFPMQEYMRIMTFE